MWELRERMKGLDIFVCLYFLKKNYDCGLVFGKIKCEGKMWQVIPEKITYFSCQFGIEIILQPVIIMWIYYTIYYRIYKNSIIYIYNICTDNKQFLQSLSVCLRIKMIKFS